MGHVSSGGRRRERVELVRVALGIAGGEERGIEKSAADRESRKVERG